VIDDPLEELGARDRQEQSRREGRRKEESSKSDSGGLNASFHIQRFPVSPLRKILASKNELKGEKDEDPKKKVEREGKDVRSGGHAVRVCQCGVAFLKSVHVESEDWGVDSSRSESGKEKNRRKKNGLLEVRDQGRNEKKIERLLFRALDRPLIEGPFCAL